MGEWIIRWSYDKPSYAPGEHGIVSFWIENTGNANIYLSDLQLEFDFGTYDLKTISGMVSQRENKFLGNDSFLLPENVVGRRLFKFNYRIYEYINNDWVDLGCYSSDGQYFISVYPRPFYRAFLSRGLSTEDKALGNPIAKMIREWGFETVTIGIEVEVPEEQVPMAAREWVKKSNALIAIATPRYIDALTGMWKTLEWLHNETGIAFGIDKPLLILKDKRVSLGGLPSYLNTTNQPVIEFDPYDMNEVKTRLPAIMPGFREWVETKRRKEFFETLGKIVVGGLAVVGGIAIISGITGAEASTSKK